MNSYCLVIINDFPQQGGVIPARTIAENLFESGLWLFSPHTAKMNSLRPGTKAVVYAAGKGNRVFLGHFSIKTVPAALDLPQHLTLLAKLYSLACEIGDGELWEEPKPMKELLEGSGIQQIGIIEKPVDSDSFPD